MVKQLHLDDQPKRRRFRTDSYGTENMMVFRESSGIATQVVADPEPVEKVVMEVDGGHLNLRLVGTAGQETDDLLASELLARYPDGTRMFRFTAIRSMDGRRKKLSMRPPTTHRIKLPGETKRLWIKELNWKYRYMIVG